MEESSTNIPSSGNGALDDFRAGVTACLRSWSALRTAVETGWGGLDSHAKAEDLRRYIFEKFDGSSCPPKGMDLHDLEDDLAIYMEEEFSVTLEDGSERQVADSIWKMYEACSKGNNSLAMEMIQKSIQALSQVASFPVKVQTSEQDEDDDEMDEAPTLVDHQMTASMLGVTASSSAEYAAQDLFPGSPTIPTRSNDNESVRQLGETPQSAPVEVEMDEDGFAPVTSKRKGKR